MRRDGAIGRAAMPGGLIANAAVLALVLGAAVIAGLAFPAQAVAASPTPTRPVSLDTRSPLEGPGFVGSPGTAILVVLAIALAAVVITTVYVRLSRNAGDPQA